MSKIGKVQWNLLQHHGLCQFSNSQISADVCVLMQKDVISGLFSRCIFKCCHHLKLGGASGSVPATIASSSCTVLLPSSAVSMCSNPITNSCALKPAPQLQLQTHILLCRSIQMMYLSKARHITPLDMKILQLTSFILRSFQLVSTLSSTVPGNNDMGIC